MRVRLAAALVAMTGLLIGGCGGIIDPSKNTVDSFSDTLTPLGAAVVKKFNVNNNGEYSVKITAMTPTPTAVVGLDLYFGPNCDALVNRNNFATLNQTAFTGLIQQKGNYCVAVFESIALPAPLTVTVAFSHP
jgi:hypothetical protein